MASMYEHIRYGGLSRDRLFKCITEAEEKRPAAESSLAQSSLAQSRKPKIQTVPHRLRGHKDYEEYYEPRVIAVGPLTVFRLSGEQREVGEKIKLALAARFIKDSGREAEDLLKIIKDNIEILWDCYYEESIQECTAEGLAQLLFLDGCSTLQFIYSFMRADLASFKIKRDQVAFARQDLFLLENQLPYQVLTLLMSSSNKHAELKIAIEEFVQAMATEKKSTVLEPTRRYTSQPGDTSIINMGNTREEPEPTHLLELLRTKMLGPPKSNAKKEKVEYGRRHSVHNTQELREAGIRFKPSKKRSLRDVSFTSLGFLGLLRLPPISVDDSMGVKFMNLIAYEMCPDFENDFGVISYIWFLDSLIDHADDVKQLRSAGVLYNFLGSDEEVAQLFSEISTGLVPNSDTYCTVKAKIEKHYTSKCKTWLANFCHKHFIDPWTVLTFILGVLASLMLSSIQTWYTINPPCDSVCQYLKTHVNMK